MHELSHTTLSKRLFRLDKTATQMLCGCRLNEQLEIGANLLEIKLIAEHVYMGQKSHSSRDKTITIMLESCFGEARRKPVEL